jgi:hypothetical protein
MEFDKETARQHVEYYKARIEATNPIFQKKIQALREELERWEKELERLNNG